MVAGEAGDHPPSAVLRILAAPAGNQTVETNLSLLPSLTCIHGKHTTCTPVHKPGMQEMFQHEADSWCARLHRHLPRGALANVSAASIDHRAGSALHDMGQEIE